MSSRSTGASASAGVMSRPWPAAYGRLLASRLLLRSYFFLPYLVLYARHVGVSLGTLLLIEALFALLTVVADLPLGQVADRIGPRQAVAIGVGCEGAAALLMGLWPNVLVFWAVQPAFAVACALTQGSDAGLASALLRRAGRESEFAAGERLFQASALAWNAAVFVTASALSLVSLRMTFIACGVVQCAAVLLVLTVPDARTPGLESGGAILLREQLGVLVRSVRTTPGLVRALASMVLTGTAFAILLYLTPVYVVGAGVDPGLVGVAAAGAALLGALVLRFAPPGLGQRTVLVAAVGATVALAFHSMAAVLIAILVVQCTQARLLPAYRALVLRDLAHVGDATAMSVVTTASSVGFAVLAPFLGLLLTWIDPQGLALVCALLFTAGGAVVGRSHRNRGADPAPVEDVHPLVEQTEAA
jgi:MFS family permease